MKKILVRIGATILLGASLLFNNVVNAQEISDEQLKLLQSLPPEQIQALIKQAIATMPEEKRALIEESLDAINNKVPTPNRITTKNKKDVVFIPIAHAGQPEFYESLTNLIKDYKNQGYVIFYEQIKPDTHLPKPQLDSVRYEFRKIMGGEPTRETYSMLTKFFPGIVIQPLYDKLGVTDTDENVDVYTSDMVKEYRRLYGDFSLTECDYNTAFGTKLYPCDKLDNDTNPIVLDFRNKHVAESILKSKHKKIVVVYGQRHMEGILELIK